MKKLVWTIMVAILMVSGISSTVKAASFGEEVQISATEYKIMEEEYINCVKQILLEKGCKDAGVSLTYVTDGKNGREYTVTIHHKKLERLEKDEFSLLMNRIEEAGERILFCEIDARYL